MKERNAYYRQMGSSMRSADAVRSFGTSQVSASKTDIQ
jgi:hypothetical protein